MSCDHLCNCGTCSAVLFANWQDAIGHAERFHTLIPTAVYATAGLIGGHDDCNHPHLASALPLVMVLKRSCPAVSHICSLTHLLSRNIFLILKSMLQTHSTHTNLNSWHKPQADTSMSCMLSSGIDIRAASAFGVGTLLAKACVAHSTHKHVSHGDE